MRIWIISALSGLAILTSASSAYATGGFACEIDDANLRLEVESGFGHGMGAPLLNFAGQLTLSPTIAPKELEKVSLNGDNLPHHWLHYDELRLLIYVETQGDLPFSSAEIVIMTKTGEEGMTYEGQYTLWLFSASRPTETIERHGKAKCSLSE
ncbi:hypothetical protein IB238_00820 [Rhizobium sp. ARZ01]|uniref:hypothetical protein n=1 Tax=Rhizobium sp. ARZ01 TaxID=2769313 RepID=UPI0017832A01|nr:hypothetical protein [Rhizobium sp. ARZ01]MBD9371179.1 hypothetical protein [Rhizobium sp. ARZ01]